MEAAVGGLLHLAPYGLAVQAQQQAAAVHEGETALQSVLASAAADARVRPAFPKMLPGTRAEVQGCDATCDAQCSECAWEACTIINVHGPRCDIRIASDGTLYERVDRAKIRLSSAQPQPASGELGRGKRQRTVRDQNE